MDNCVFCKIVNKEIPSFIIYEDSFCMAFLDIQPISDGHSVLIPKVHSENLMEANNEILEKLLLASKKIMKLLKEKLNVSNFNILSNIGKTAGQSVFHTHIHIIPRYSKDEMSLNFKINNKTIEKVSLIYDKLK